MQIDINLASQPFVDQRPILRSMRKAMVWLTVLIVALATSTYFVHQRAEHARLRVKSLEANIVHVTAEQKRYRAMMQLPENVAVLRDSAKLNQLVDAKAFSWTLAMEDLETVLPAGVQVTAIEPVRAKDGTVTLHIRVHGPRDKSIELVRNLELSRCFRSPRIAGEAADSTGQSSRPDAIAIPDGTQLDLFAEYDPDFSERANEPASPAMSKAGTDAKRAPGKPRPSLQRDFLSTSTGRRSHLTAEAGGAE